MDFDLDEELEVWVIGPRSGAFRLLAPAAGDQIDALPFENGRRKRES